MEENSTKDFNVDTSDVDKYLEATSTCNIINATTTTTTPNVKSKILFSECPNITVSPDFSYLAELYWKYPTVHQTFIVSPGFHTNHALLARARRKSEKLKRELEKEPVRHKVPPIDAASITKSKSSKNTAEIQKTESRKSKALVAATTPVQQRRRTVNLSIVGDNTNNVNRRLTLQPTNRSQKSLKHAKKSDPGAALAEFRALKGVSRANPSENKTPIYTETPMVLDALREQREDLEKREEEKHQSPSLLSKLSQRCCGLFRQCIGSSKVNWVVFFVIVIIVIILCITAIAYPIARAVTLRKESKPK